MKHDTMMSRREEEDTLNYKIIAWIALIALVMAAVI